MKRVSCLLARVLNDPRLCHISLIHELMIFNASTSYNPLEIRRYRKLDLTDEMWWFLNFRDLLKALKLRAWWRVFKQVAGTCVMCGDCPPQVKRGKWDQYTYDLHGKVISCWGVEFGGRINFSLPIATFDNSYRGAFHLRSVLRILLAIQCQRFVFLFEKNFLFM